MERAATHAEGQTLQTASAHARALGRDVAEACGGGAKEEERVTFLIRVQVEDVMMLRGLESSSDVFPKGLIDQRF